MNRRTKIIISTAFFIFQPIFSQAFEDTKTHPKLTEEAIKKSLLKVFLEGNLGITKGFKEVLNDSTTGKKNSIQKWIQKGSELEDNPNCRASNHFHDPLLPWKQAGLTDSRWSIDKWCSATSPYRKKFSNLVWATGIADSSGTRLENVPNNDFVDGGRNWRVAKEWLHKALTWEGKAARETALARTFLTLGHILHLLQDVAVPAHTRNDFSQGHTKVIGCPDGEGPCVKGWVGNPFEGYVRDNYDEIEAAIAVDYDKTPAVVRYTGEMKLTNFWDTDTYNPDTAPPTNSATQGLSEYSNGNFVSHSTIFIPETDFDNLAHYYPYPARTSTNIGDYPETMTLKEVRAKDGKTDKVFYIEKNEDGEQIDHFLSARYIWNDNFFPNWEYNLRYKLDHECFKEYGTRLIPRAVGYSAGLIDYFFRGDLHLNREATGITVRNDSKEVMTFYSDRRTQKNIGSISIYYDDTNKVRHHLGTANLTTPLSLGDDLFVQCNTSYPPTDNIEEGRYIAVFHGKLGDEEGAVVGKVDIKPIRVYYVAEYDGLASIMRMDSDGNNKLVFYEQPGILYGKLDLSPDGNTLAFSTEGPQIYLLNLVNGNVNFLVFGYGPDWSPDGTKLLYHREEEIDDNYFTEIYLMDNVMDAANRQETQLTQPPEQDYCEGSFNAYPAWSPDGNFIAYTSWCHPVAGYEQGGCDYLELGYSRPLYLMDSLGNVIRPVSCQNEIGDNGYPLDIIDTWPTWSPDGKEIAYSRELLLGDDSRYRQLYKVNLETDITTKLTTTSGIDLSEEEKHPSWSFDNHFIAISTSRGADDTDIWLIDPNGNGYLKNITDDNGGSDAFPSVGW